MADYELNELISLAEAVAILPMRQDGTVTETSTLRSWARSGVNGVFLRVVKVGAGIFTTKCWIREFIDASSEVTKKVGGNGCRQGGAK